MGRDGDGSRRETEGTGKGGLEWFRTFQTKVILIIELSCKSRVTSLLKCLL